MTLVCLMAPCVAVASQQRGKAPQAALATPKYRNVSPLFLRIKKLGDTVLCQA